MNETRWMSTYTSECGEGTRHFSHHKWRKVTSTRHFIDTHAQYCETENPLCRASETPAVHNRAIVAIECHLANAQNPMTPSEKTRLAKNSPTIFVRFNDRLRSGSPACLLEFQVKPPLRILTFPSVHKLCHGFLFACTHERTTDAVAKEPVKGDARG